ncbi:MAG: hypothetical protein ABIH48_01275, partial [Candidatus Falkowbacteria bacterium]
RQQIVKAVSGDDNTKEERPVVPKHLRALDRSREDEIRPQRKFQTVGSLTSAPVNNTISKAPTAPPRMPLAS